MKITAHDPKSNACVLDHCRLGRFVDFGSLGHFFEVPVAEPPRPSEYCVSGVLMGRGDAVAQVSIRTYIETAYVRALGGGETSTHELRIPSRNPKTKPI